MTQLDLRAKLDLTAIADCMHEASRILMEAGPAITEVEGMASASEAAFQAGRCDGMADMLALVVRLEQQLQGE